MRQNLIKAGGNLQAALDAARPGDVVDVVAVEAD
jgi:hypothetical protein